MCPLLQQHSVTHLNRESQEILVEVFRAASQNVKAPLVSTLLKPVDGKLHSAMKRRRRKKDNYKHKCSHVKAEMFVLHINTAYICLNIWTAILKDTHLNRHVFFSTIYTLDYLCDSPSQKNRRTVLAGLIGLFAQCSTTQMDQLWPVSVVLALVVI